MQHHLDLRVFQRIQHILKVKIFLPEVKVKITTLPRVAGALYPLKEAG